MKVKLEELKESFKICDTVPLNVVLDSSQYVRLKQDGTKLSLAMCGALASESSLTGITQGSKWTTFVDRVTMKKFLSTASEDEVEIIHNKDKLILKSGQRLELSHPNQISGYTLSAFKATIDTSDEVLRFLKTAVRYLPTQSGTEKISAVAFNREAILVTDSVSIMAMIGQLVASNYFMPPDIARVLSVFSPAKLAIEKAGVGVSLSNGAVFQSLSDELKNYPLDKCLEWVKDGEKCPELLKFSASEFLDALRVASQFLKEKTDPIKIEEVKDNLKLTAITSNGNLQRQIPLISSTKTNVDVGIRADKAIPWLEYMTSIDANAEVGFGRLQFASVFKVLGKPFKNMLLVVDL